VIAEIVIQTILIVTLCPDCKRVPALDEKIPNWSSETEEQIAFALSQADGGTAVGEVCVPEDGHLGAHPFDSAQGGPFYRWKKKYPGMGVFELGRMRQLEEENRRLRQLVADLALDKVML